MKTVAPEAVPVCDLAEIEDPGAFGFSLPDGRPAFLVRQGDAVRGYLNRCPHMGNRLDWAPHRFLNRARDLILCASHGAVFELQSGLCVGGPCLGRTLPSLRVEVVSGQVFVHLDDAG